MDYKLAKLENGITLITVPMPSLESATVSVWVKTGSRFEDDKNNGISHFMEHMVFKGSKKYPSAKAISEVVDSFGGEFNAGTSKEWTNFYIKARTGNMITAFDIISDMLKNPLLKSEEIEKEKGVIVEEINMYEDTPMFRVGDIFEQVIFKNHPLGRDIAGTEKTVRGITREDFISYRNKFYYGQNIYLTVSGGISEEDAMALANDYFSEIKAIPAEKNIDEEFICRQKTPQILVHSKKNEQAHFILGFLGGCRTDRDRYVESVLSTILGGGMSSRLFLEVREKRGLAYAVRASVDRYIDTGYLGVYAGVDPKKVDEALKVVLDQLYGLAAKKYPITTGELVKAKEYLKGHLALALEDTRDVNGFFADQAMFLDEILTPEEVFEKIDKVDMDQVYEYAGRIINKEVLNLAVIGPFEGQERFAEIINK